MIKNDEIRVWGIHTRDDLLFLNESIIAIGWKEMGDLKKLDSTREAIKEHYITVYPDAKKGSIGTAAGMLFRFAHELQVGDYIIFPSKIDRQINIGTVIGEYMHNPDAYEYVQQRKVKWIKHLPRTAFSQGALYEVGSALSFFSVKNYADKYLEALDKNFKINNIVDSDEENEIVAITADEIVETTKDFIILFSCVSLLTLFTVPLWSIYYLVAFAA